MALTEGTKSVEYAILSLFPPVPGVGLLLSTTLCCHPVLSPPVRASKPNTLFVRPRPVCGPELCKGTDGGQGHGLGWSEVPALQKLGEK